MKNVEMSVQGTILTIKVDLSKEYGRSSSGKTIIVASTEGNIEVKAEGPAALLLPNGCKVGLNVYKYPTK